LKKIRKMSIKEFREKGYLQELNRQFLHPLGLALEIEIDEAGSDKLGGIWDYREDKEGIYYDLENSSENRKQASYKKWKFIYDQKLNRHDYRKNHLGWVLEPINTPVVLGEKRNNEI